MKIELLQALIAAWPTNEAARLCDEHDNIIAQNAASVAAQSHCNHPASTCSDPDACADAFWRTPATRTLQLVDNWSLQTRSVEDETHTEFAERPIEVQELARGVAHELRNPLAAIVTAAGLLQDDNDSSEETLLLLNVIRKESRRMNRILTEFAAYVKPRPPQAETFDAAQIVREQTHSEITETNIAIEDQLPEHLSVHTDMEQFREVIAQVLHNAREAMPHGGHLVLQGEKVDGTVHLHISDNGVGLSEDAQHNAFQPFFSSKSHSTGLGLSIARSAIEGSGGKIWIENRSDDAQSGARVSLELPTAP